MLWIVFLLVVISGTVIAASGTVVGMGIGMIAAVSPAAVSIIAGLVLTLTPAYFLLRWMLGWALAIPATVLEGGWFLVSLRRSLHLSKGARWRIFVLYFLMGVLGFVVSIMVEFLLMFGVAFLRIRDPQIMAGLFQAVWAICVFISTSLVGALGTIAMTLVYYDQRVRKEAFDLQLMMSTLQSANSIPTVASAPQ